MEMVTNLVFSLLLGFFTHWYSFISHSKIKIFIFEKYDTPTILPDTLWGSRGDMAFCSYYLSCRLVLSKNDEYLRKLF